MQQFAQKRGQTHPPIGQDASGEPGRNGFIEGIAYAAQKNGRYLPLFGNLGNTCAFHIGSQRTKIPMQCLFGIR